MSRSMTGFIYTWHALFKSYCTFKWIVIWRHIYIYVYIYTQVVLHTWMSRSMTGLIHTWHALFKLCCTHQWVVIWRHVNIHVYTHTQVVSHTTRLIHLCGADIGYGVALVSWIDGIIGLFCKRALWKRQYSAKETYNFIDPTKRSHPIAYSTRHVGYWIRHVTYEWVMS